MKEDASDSALVELARTHEARADQAFRLLYDRHKDAVYGFLVKLTGNATTAEDALQETFFRVFKGLASFDAGRPFRAWLYQIARNTALDAFRAARKEARLAEEKARRLEPPAEDRQEELARTRAALARIPEEARALLLQRFGLGMKLEELAESFAVTERTIRFRLRDAAGELARAYALEGGRS